MGSDRFWRRPPPAAPDFEEGRTGLLAGPFVDEDAGILGPLDPDDVADAEVGGFHLGGELTVASELNDVSEASRDVEVGGIVLAEAGVDLADFTDDRVARGTVRSALRRRRSHSGRVRGRRTTVGCWMPRRGIRGLSYVVYMGN